MILEYLEKEYRPYAVTDLVLNLHNQISKVNMVKLLDELTAEGEILSKTYGKSTYYCYRMMDEQNDGSKVNATIEMVKQLREELKETEVDAAEKKKGMFYN